MEYGIGEFRMRNGEKAVVDMMLGVNPYKLQGHIDGVYCTWTTAGRVFRSREDPHDLVAPWVEPAPADPIDFDLEAHLTRQREFSLKTFGPGPRTKGVSDHIRKELTEIADNPLDLKEWVDVILLAFDGAWRAGWEPQDIIAAIVAKQTKNEARDWPDWRTADPDKAIEHIRDGEQG